jgi:hypothetical protein
LTAQSLASAIERLITAPSIGRLHIELGSRSWYRIDTYFFSGMCLVAFCPLVPELDDPLTRALSVIPSCGEQRDPVMAELAFFKPDDSRPRHITFVYRDETHTLLCCHLVYRAMRRHAAQICQNVRLCGAH